MTPTRETAIQMARDAGAVIELGLAPVFHTHAQIEALVAAAYELGATQAQQTTEPELPEAVAWQFIDDEESGYTSYRKDPPADTQVAYLKQWNRPAWEPLFTATQMHDHYQAGVRAGMAQQQATQRGIDKVLADPVKHGLDLGEQ